ncbi:hypothetical protein M378DRAFT_509420 [Amanita muscaria Koide BX008]|uniref:Uncharacterized protein n=1 Tax=Amanita muscaria (strain Koide BX008) TaxID=946122 RepID=A0A0C2XPH2_AMAMK|nr:hypothetical protein M378DRAFT_509420 [Amanita muscaria Koide BX008]
MMCSGFFSNLFIQEHRTHSLQPAGPVRIQICEFSHHPSVPRQTHCHSPSHFFISSHCTTALMDSYYNSHTHNGVNGMTRGLGLNSMQGAMHFGNSSSIYPDDSTYVFDETNNSNRSNDAYIKLSNRVNELEMKLLLAEQDAKIWKLAPCQRQSISHTQGLRLKSLEPLLPVTPHHFPTTT